MRRPVLLALLLASIVAGPASAEDSRVIGAGVSAGGVRLSGLTVDAAARRLQDRFGHRMARPVAVRVGARRFGLSTRRARFAFDERLTAVRAWHAADAGEQKDVGLALRHSRVAVRDFAGAVRRRIAVTARSATLRLTSKRMVVRRARHGRTIDAGALRSRIDHALDVPSATRVLRGRVVKTRPAVTVEGLRRAYPTVVTVDRPNFKLRLFKRLRLAKSYGVAVGMSGLSTPAGRYRVRARQVNPAWHVPNSAWAGSLQGQVIPGGAPNNPLKARWLGLAGGVGIHGTAEEWTIGSRASHGCIRMRVRDVVDLYPRVPLGTPVLVR